jgi:isochorismate hydrolase
VKHSYFTSDSIHQKAGEMLAELVDFRQKRARPFVPEVSALLVLDMQKYFLQADSHAYIPSAPAIVPGIKSLIQSYAGQGLPVVFTQHVNTAQDAGMMANWWYDLITESSSLSQISAELDSSSGILLRKSQYDAFYQTDLAALLRARAVTQVVICGVMTHLCCETTARSAFVRGFEVFFTIDGTATYRENFHRATLLNLGHGVATLVLVDEILAQLRMKNGH